MIRYFYVRNNDKHPIGCLAMEANSNGRTVSYALSTANPKDDFNKARARSIASARLCDPWQVEVSNKSFHTIMRTIMSDLSSFDNSIVPTRIKRAAQKWLAKGPTKGPAATHSQPTATDGASSEGRDFSTDAT